MAKEWQTFVRKFADLREGKIELFIKDLTSGPRKYDTKHVIAEVLMSPQSGTSFDTLWVRGESGLKSPEPWYVRILEELPEWVEGRPHQDIFEAIKNQEKESS